MKASWTLFAVAVVACGSGSDGGTGNENLAGATAALSVPGLTPVPCDAQARAIWNGTPVQLMLADAYAGCTVDLNSSGTPVRSETRELSFADTYLSVVVERIRELI